MNRISKGNNTSACHAAGRDARCDICFTEIPLSVAKSVEGLDYVHYFCSPDCMTKWLEQAKTGRVTAARQ